MKRALEIGLVLRIVETIASVYPDAARGNISDVMLALTYLELFLFRQRVKTRGFIKGLINQRRTDSMIDDEIETELLAGITELRRKRIERARFTAKKWPHIENRKFIHSWSPKIGLFLYIYRSEEHTSELQSLMRTSYAVFFLKKKKKN